MSLRRSTLLVAVLALSACASVLGLPDEYTGGSDEARTDAGAEASDDGPSTEGEADHSAPSEASVDADTGVEDAPGDALEDLDAGLDADADLPAPPAILGLGAGTEHACAIVYTLSGAREPRCWGSCGNNRLGRACTSGVAISPVPILQNSGLAPIGNALAVAGALNSTCVLLKNGTVECVGACEYGQLGNSAGCSNIDAGSNDSVDYPVPVLDQSSNPVGQLHSLDGVGSHYCAAGRGGQVFCWGAYEWQVALEPTAWRAWAEAQKLPGSIVSRVARGSHHSCAVATSDVYCWGENHGGPLGYDGDASTQPVQIQLGAEAFDVSRGHQSACALIAQDDSVRCWGDWGDPSGPPTPAGVPVDGGGLKDIHMLAGAYHFTCGLGPAGQVLCWGQYPERWAGRYASGSIAEFEPPFLIETSAGVPLQGMKYIARSRRASVAHQTGWRRHSLPTPRAQRCPPVHEGTPEESGLPARRHQRGGPCPSVEPRLRARGPLRARLPLPSPRWPLLALTRAGGPMRA